MAFLFTCIVWEKLATNSSFHVDLFGIRFEVFDEELESYKTLNKYTCPLKETGFDYIK